MVRVKWQAQAASAMVRTFRAMLAAAALLIVPLAVAEGGHHGSDCDLYGAPHLHAVDDGHTHWHHMGPDVVGHFHGATWYDAGHTHTDHHSPCMQTGMAVPAYGDAPALREVSWNDALTGTGPAGTVRVLLPSGEAYELNAAALEERHRIAVRGDGDRDLSRFPGTGTPDDPFVVSGLLVRDELDLKNTDACMVVRDNVFHPEALVGPFGRQPRAAEKAYESALEDLRAANQAIVDAGGRTEGQLELDWNGQCVHTYHNVIHDLRVNQNNRRLGYATGGVLEDNRIERVGQLRHYDGIFRHNEIGDRSELARYADGAPDKTGSLRVTNVDGFNQGQIIENTFYGGVDLDFHGHHHSNGFLAPHSHYHGNLEARKYVTDHDGNFVLDANGDKIPLHDHTLRWTSVLFADNLVIDPLGYGLRYEDRNHQGDDRTANSENMQELNAPHIHQAHIQITGNTILGTLWIDQFMSQGIALDPADYSKADGTEAETVNSHIDDASHGWLDITENTVLLPERARGTSPRGGLQGHNAFELEDARLATLALTGNHALLVQEDASLPSADRLLGFLRSTHDESRAWTTDQVAKWHRKAGEPTHHQNAYWFEDFSHLAATLCNNVAGAGFADAIDGNKIHDSGTNEGVSFTYCNDNDWGNGAINIDEPLRP